MATEQMNTAQTDPQNTSDVKIPEDALIIIAVRDMVLFPGAIGPIAIARPKSIAAAQQALREQRPIGIVLQRSPETDEPGPDDLYRVATIANIVRYITAPDGTHHIVCQGVQRARILDFLPGTPFPAARIQQIPEPTANSPEIEARALNLQRLAIEAIELLPQAPPELGGGGGGGGRDVPEHHRARRAGRPGDLVHGHQGAGQAGGFGDHRPRFACREGVEASGRTAGGATHQQ
ncbi:hypothetical protein ACVW0I_005847 [Bradyrhizobium sp. LM6.11]